MIVLHGGGHLWSFLGGVVVACVRVWALGTTGADCLSLFLGGGGFCGLFWVVEADCGGGVVINGSRVLVGLVA